MILSVDLSKPAFDLIGDARCTGCAACANVCERSATIMQMSAEGFYRPQVDRAMCNNCGVCARKCPVIAEERGDLQRVPWSEPHAFAAWSRDESIHLGSSSGGAFTELARAFLRRGGVVVGCGWSENWTPMHTCTRSEDELVAFRGSKYIPSSIGNILSEVVQFCKNGVPVLFSGTPCQVAAVKRLVPARAEEHLLTCEVICHGVPSLRLFQSYLHWLFPGDGVQEFSFRDKSLGWQTVRVVAENGKVYQSPLSADPFGRIALVYHLPLMEACFQCVFQRLPRLADITLGDFWGVPTQLENPKGVSLVLTNSGAGDALWSEVVNSGAVESTIVNLSIATAKNPRATGVVRKKPLLHRYFLSDVAHGWTFRGLFWKYYWPVWTMERVRIRLGLVTAWFRKRLKGVGK